MPKAIITGATKGIGRAIAERLLNEGFDIVFCARNENEVKALQAAWQADFKGQSINGQAVDVSIEKDIKAFAYFAVQQMSSIDILVNNAGIFFPGNIIDEAEGQLEKTLQTNLLSAYHLTRIVVPYMKIQKRGHIFNMCSIASLKAYPGGGSYSISKYALLGFSDNLRLELMKDNIKVTAVSPGAVWSNSWSQSGIPESRMMKAEDIAAIIWNAYSLSPQATVEHIVLRPQQGDL